MVLKGLAPWSVVKIPDLTAETGPGDFRALQRFSGDNPTSLVQHVLTRFPFNKDMPAGHPALTSEAAIREARKGRGELVPTDAAFHRAALARAIHEDISEKIHLRWLKEEREEMRADRAAIAREERAQSEFIAWMAANKKAQRVILAAAKLLVLDARTVRDAVALHRIDMARERTQIGFAKQAGIFLPGGGVPVSVVTMEPQLSRLVENTVERNSNLKGTSLMVSVESIKQMIGAVHWAMAVQRQPAALQGPATTLHGNTASAPQPLQVAPAIQSIAPQSKGKGAA